MSYSCLGPVYRSLCVSYPFGTMQQSDLVLIIHDAFQPLSYWQGFMPSPTYVGVMMDTHRYQMFSVAARRSYFSYPYSFTHLYTRVGGPIIESRTHTSRLQSRTISCRLPPLDSSWRMDPGRN